MRKIRLADAEIGQEVMIRGTVVGRTGGNTVEVAFPWDNPKKPREVIHRWACPKNVIVIEYSR